ncbi:MAG: polysaccharide deacetylase family protein [Pseudorhodoplanes sp.]|jgi:peptidoglycan/xylan/chitin deacetylase (PgdA/CDA1 family)|nr:polysaccharide deacetylase family protein [Pseudorhodoplanes sp.]
MFDLTLSFDNGPEPDVTPQVLDILARRGLKTTFFIIGQKLADPKRRALAERAHAEGHWIGNHSWTHSVPLGERRQTPDLAETEIGQTQRIIGALAHPHKLFRPFGGGGNLDSRLMNSDIVNFLKAGRFTCVLWNSIPRDWNDPDGWVERAIQHCQRQPWTLMVLHDLPTGAMRHLDRFLDKVGELGGRLHQDFPPDCVPIVDGIVVRPIDSYVAAA